MHFIRNIKYGEGRVQGEVYFSAFGKFIALYVEDDMLSFAATCAAYLNALSDELIDELCEASIRYCNDYLHDIGQPQKVFPEKRSVLDLIQPKTLIVPYPKRSEPVIHLELDCAWAPDLGMEWVIREDKVRYVGGFNDLDPWGEFADRGYA